MCDVFTRLFNDSTEPRCIKLRDCYQDNKRRENENIKILQKNHKLSTTTPILYENSPFDVQKVNLFKSLDHKQDKNEETSFLNSNFESLNKDANEPILPNFNTINNKNKTRDYFHTPKRELVNTGLVSNQLNSNFNKTANSTFSYLQKQNNLALTMPKPQPQLQIRHFDINSTEKYSTSRSQKNSTHAHFPSSNTSSRSLNKMKVKMKNGRFLSKKEVDCDHNLNLNEMNINPRKYKKEITHIEKMINENKEKMRFGYDNEKEKKVNALRKSNKKKICDQITPRLRKNPISITPNLVLNKKVDATPKSLLVNDKKLNSQVNLNRDLNIDKNLDLNNSNSNETFDLYNDLNSRLNSTLSKNLKTDLDDDSSLSENINFDDHFKKHKSQFGSKFDFLFSDDEMIHHKNSLDKCSDVEQNQEIIMVDQNFWNLHMANLIPTETNQDENETSKENEAHSSSFNSLENPIILETSLNSPLEETAANPMSTTLFSWELAGYANYFSDM